MASTAFPDLAKKAVLRDGTTYGYIHVPPRDPLKPTLLLLHGFPSSSYDWRHQITHLPAAGFGVLVPDLLGYGDTDKPDDPEKYRLANMASQVDELLSHVGLEKVIGVAHDWYVLPHLRFREDEMRRGWGDVGAHWEYLFYSCTIHSRT